MITIITNSHDYRISYYPKIVNSMGGTFDTAIEGRGVTFDNPLTVSFAGFESSAIGNSTYVAPYGQYTGFEAVIGDEDYVSVGVAYDPPSFNPDLPNGGSAATTYYTSDGKIYSNGSLHYSNAPTYTEGDIISVLSNAYGVTFMKNGADVYGVVGDFGYAMVTAIKEPVPVTTGDHSVSSGENTLFLPLKALNDEQYASIKLRGLENQWPQYIYDNGNYPNRGLYFWPIPKAINGVELWLWEPLTQYSSLDTELNLPQGYERYLRFKLALELAPEFGKEPSPEIVRLATEAEANLKSLNQKTPLVKPSGAFSNKPAINYITFITSADTLPEV